MNPLTFSAAVRTDFSLGESSLQMDAMFARAKELGIETIATADTMTLAGMPALFDKARKSGLKAICGCTLRVVETPAERLKDRELKPFRLKVYIKDETGLKSLFKLLSLGLQPDHFYYHSRVSLGEVLALEGVVVTSGDLHSLWHRDDAASIDAILTERFGDDYYTELVGLDTPLFDKLNRLAHAGSAGRRFIVTRPVFYADTGASDSTDVLRAIASNTQVSSIFLARPHVRDMEMLAPIINFSHMQAVLTKLGDAELGKNVVANLRALASSCTYEFKKMEPCLPKMADNEFLELTQRVGRGWGERFSRQVWGHAPAPEDLPGYKERLAFELGVIKKMNFSGYFLLVQDIVLWSKSKGIMVGPGRGSVGGSLVAYLMGITDIDPIRFGLLFERFINPDRVDLPDADLDFMSRRRHEILDMLTERFGEDKVCGIANFTTLGPASALRDTARVHGLEPWEYACSKQMEKEHGVSLSLTESAEVVPEIDKFREARPLIWQHALNLEGANRGLGRHAAGVVVAGEPVVNRGVVSTQSGQAVVQWDKSRVEDFGLIKIDVLALNTLDVIDATLTYIKDRHHKTIDVLALPLDDEKVLRAFALGKTTGIFQFEGGGMKKLLKDLAEREPLTFDDICAATALFRPGPLDAGLCDRYVKVKQGKAAIYYEHPALEPILEKTLGVMVYQEQTMKVSVELAGFTPGESDILRKAIGKKDAAKMETMAEQFITGAIAGYIEVELEDGSKVTVHRCRKFKCDDGALRTVERAMADGIGIPSFL